MTAQSPSAGFRTGLSRARAMHPLRQVLQSTVYLAWGYVSAARQAAFDADMVTPGMHNPQQLKVLVLTNLALDAPEVAEKYLGILDKTLFHRAWSGNMRRLMADPAAAEKDETLARLRRSLPQTNISASSTSVRLKFAYTCFPKWQCFPPQFA